MGLVSRITDFENKFKVSHCNKEKTLILTQFKGFSMVEQGLEDVPKVAQETIWKEAQKEAQDFYTTFYNVGVLGRKYKEGYLQTSDDIIG